MKLSAAMRIGSMTTRQIKCMWSDGGNGRCALGAVAEACGFKDFINGHGCSNETMRKFPELDEPIVYPEFDSVNFIGYGIINPTVMPLGTAIASLNDIEGWSRDRIADWIETLELAREIKSPEVEHATCIKS